MVDAITYSINGAWVSHLFVVVPNNETYVETCPLTKFDRGLNDMHEGRENAIEWLENLDIRLWDNLTQ